jgi:peroxiredoxin
LHLLLELRILNYPALASKINEYFSFYCDNTISAYKEGTDVLMSKISNEQIKNYVFNHILNIFLTKNSDALVTYLYDKYSDGCGVRLPAEKMNEFSSIVQTQVGASIPNIILNDTKSELVGLQNFVAKNKYTVVYVWMASCHACQTKTPKLEQVISPYLKKGLGVYSISLDEKKEDWYDAVLKYNIQNWTNVCELTSLQNSSVLPKLNIRTTPKLFIIDKSGKIVAKDIFGDALSSKLIELLK